MFKRHIVAFSVSGIILVVLYVAYALISREDILRMVQNQMEAAVGQKVEIGDFHLGVLPSLQVEVDDLALYRDGRRLLAVDKILLDLDLDTLMNKQLVIDSIEIDAPAVTLPESESNETEASKSVSAPPDFSALRYLQKITVRDGSVAYGRRYRLERINGEFDVSADRIRIVKLTAAFGGGHLISAVSGDLYPARMNAQIKIASKSDDPDALLQSLGVTLEHREDAFRSLALAAAVKADKDKLVLQKAKITLDDIEIEAEGMVKEYNLSKMAFRTTVGTVDLNRYLPPERNATDANASSDTGADTNASANDAALDRLITRLTRFAEGVHIVNSVKIEKVLFEKYRLGDIFFESKIADGLITIDPLTLKMYGGRLDGRLTADLRGGYPLIKGQYKISDADVEEVFRQKGIPPLLRGNVGLIGRLKTYGLTKKALLDNLNIDIALYGEQLLFDKYDIDAALDSLDRFTSFDLVDFAGIVAGPLGMILVNSYDAVEIGKTLERGGQTRIVKLLAAWKIRDFIAYTRDVAIKTPRNRIAVKGEIDLAHRRVRRLTVAVLDRKGCAKFLQTLYGTGTGGIDIENKLDIVTTPFKKLFENRENCEVFYRGKIK